ncbi:MAG: PAS domain S-box protein, partial [Anaerolineae bacterium]|nr:PAS domain S-box protein [Anaerolineae bacterium]
MFLQKNYRHIVLGYFLSASLWILLSDTVLFWLTSDDTAQAISVFKGWGFVVVTSLVLALLLRDAYQKQESAFNQISRLKRFYHVLSDSNQKLIRAPQEEELLKDICQILVEVGNYALVWVGLANTSKGIRPAAYAGDEAAYQSLTKGRWEESPEAQGPAGSAFYKKAVQLITDLTSAGEQHEKWRQQVLTHGYAAAIALPIRDGQQILGVLTVYSRHPGAFDEEEVRLLQELSDDLGYGLAALRLRKELYLSDQILQQTPDAIVVSDMKRRIIRWAGRAEELFGYSADDIIGQYGVELRAPEKIDEESVEFQRQFQETGLFFGETMCIRKNGERFPVETSARIVYDASDKPMAIVSIHRNITERKLAEKSLHD